MSGSASAEALQRAITHGNPEGSMTRKSALKYARMLRASGRKVKMHRHRGVSMYNLPVYFYTVDVVG